MKSLARDKEEEQAGEIDLAVQGRKSAPARNHKH